MPSPIAVEVVTLAGLLSDTYRFQLPWFQRAYAWPQPQVARLLGDLQTAMQRDVTVRRYFLGTLTLAKAAGETECALVDGHQRLITLSILFAVLRDLAAAPDQRAALDRFLRTSDPSRQALGDPGWRLVPQASLSDFFANHVQLPGATLEPPPEDVAALSDSERNILNARQHMSDVLGSLAPEVRGDLARFLADDCRVILHIVRDEDEAWSMVEIEEQTRVEHDPADRAKASILSVMPANDREACGPTWDLWHARLGSGDMRALLGHIRTTALRKRHDTPVETDLIQHFSLDKKGPAFFSHHIVPSAQSLRRIRRGEVGDPQTQPRITAAVTHMSWIDRNLWVPAALHWLAKRGETGDATATFFAHLERLVWIMRLGGIDPTVQENRIIRLLSEIERDIPLETMSMLAIEARAFEQALANLRSGSFYAKSYSGVVLRRIAVAWGEDPGPVDRERVTIEHILPRGPGPDSRWAREIGTRRQIQSLANKLGNLTFLTAEENQQAGTLDWPLKQPILARSVHAMARRTAQRATWDRAVIQERTEEMIATLLEAWDIPAEAPAGGFVAMAQDGAAATTSAQ